jgi:SRSO17 transposase
MCPLYVAGLIGPGDRKSVEPMASRLAPGDYGQLHHFIASGVWDEALLEEELAIQADKLIGGASAVLLVDDTALPKKGSHSVGVAPQHASALGKTANCQTLVSLTLARDEVPVMRTRPEIARSVVVLPTELGPNNTKEQPSRTSRLKRSTARTEA